MDPDPEPGPQDTVSRFEVGLEGCRLLGLYRVGKKLAEGGMGAIYRAEDTNLGRRVVVKVPHPRFLGDAEFRERLAREVGELTRLEHPHIVRILARGEHEELPFYVLQYLGGGSLWDRIHAKKDLRLPVAEILAWLETTAQTLDFVHERGIVHRDVKPANILFDEAGHVFLSDFGVAKTLQARGDAELTGTGVSIGSPRYMAPEQGAGRAVGPAADQYALASTVYEALAGAPPFEGEQIVEVLLSKLRNDAPPLGDRVPDLPPEAAAAVMRALSREPDARFPSCRAFAEAFVVGFGASAAVVEPLATSPARAGSTLRLALVVLAALAVSVGVFFVMRDRSGPSPDPAPDVPAAEAPVEKDPIEVIEFGAEPRRELRYVVAAGARERVLISMNSSTRHVVDEQEQETPPELPLEMLSVVFVREVSEDGSFRIGWEILECDVAEEHRDEAPATLRRHCASMVGLGATAVADDRGHLQSVDFADPDLPGLLLRPGASGMGIGLEMLFVPLPNEPVGVGAVWEVVKTVPHQSLRLTRTTTFELLGVEGRELRIRHAHIFSAPPQRASPPGIPEGVTLRLRDLHVVGEGEMMVDLARAVPLSGEHDLRVRVLSTHSKGEKTWDELMEQTGHTSIRRR